MMDPWLIYMTISDLKEIVFIETKTKRNRSDIRYTVPGGNQIDTFLPVNI